MDIKTNKKINKTVLLILLFAVIFIDKKTGHCTEILTPVTDNSVNIPVNSGTFTSENGLVYKINTSAAGLYECKVISYTGSSEDVIIPGQYNGYVVTSIANNAFYGNEIIKSITIGSNITSIGNGAFAYCGYLRTINFTESKIKKIPSKCFEACESLKKACLPVSVKSIGSKAFAFCNSLYQLIIPGRVTKTGSNIFYGCNKDRLTIVALAGSKVEKLAQKTGLLVTDTDKTYLSFKNITDIKGSQERLYVYSAPSKVRWKSTDPLTVKVNSSGKITALKTGTATIIAKTTGHTLKCKVRIIKRNKKNCLKVIYSRYVRKEMTDYEKIYAAHKWLVQNVKYDRALYKKGTVPAISHTAEGALDRGIAVCDGYSKAFIIIMGHYGIKCRMVTGGAHAWNIVKIKNKWYHIDCTYDDPVVNGSFNNRTVFMDFFLKTDSEMYTTHIWDYSAFPECSSKKIDKDYKT